ncbi:deleted in lung and esophageal cancer protein 1 [Pelodytes ibericus]
MSTDELLRTALPLSPDPATYRPKPSSQRTQDISHLLTNLFKELYTGEVIGEDTGANLIRSRGGDNPYHQEFVEDLEQIRSEYARRMEEANMVERHIIQARARATAEEERTLSRLKSEAGEKFQTLGLPPVDSYFSWCVDSSLLKKHKLICPDDYITESMPVTRAPKGKLETSLLKETVSFHQHVSRSPVDDGFTESPLPEIKHRDFLDTSLSDLTLSSTSDIVERCTKKSSKKSTPAKEITWKEAMSAEDRAQERSRLAQLERRHNFLKNPRFLPPHGTRGGRSLIIPTKKAERLISGRRMTVEENDPHQPIPVFVANPPIVFFPYYEVGQIYEMTVELRNMTASSRHVRVIPPSTPHFSVSLGKFPGEGGTVAPGMSCHYTIRFVPDSLADFEDFLLVESQAPYRLFVPIEARRDPPILTIPHTLDCGPCLVGGIRLLECLCRNEGLSRGRFCIMPKNAWPPANFRSVATTGFVEMAPFGIRPSFFELYPGQEMVIEVAFFPASDKTYEQVFTIVCDNCQVKDFTVTGYGQLAGLQLVSVSDGRSTPGAEEMTDALVKNLVRFPRTNLHSRVQKSLVIRNTTHVALPFYWRIIKPNLQTLLPREPVDMAKIKSDEDTRMAFSMSPMDGVLEPHQVHTFSVVYSPTELTDYHSVAQMLLRNIPEPPSAGKQPASLPYLEQTVNDVLVLDMEFEGSTEPFKILLVPYTIIFPGEAFIGTTMRKRFEMWNNSLSAVTFQWEMITSHHIIQIEPSSGRIEPSKHCEFELCVTGECSGFTSRNVRCFIEHSSEPVVLCVEATFKGPVVSIDAPSLDLSLMKLGSRTWSVITIVNDSPLVARWRMRESRACLDERREEESKFSISPETGELSPRNTAKVTIMYQPLTCQKLQTVLELEVEDGETSYLPVTANIQTPQVCLLSSLLEFNDLYLGVPAQTTVRIFNQGYLPAAFSWGEVTGIDATHCSCTISPACGTLGPNEEAELCVTFTAHTLGELNDVVFTCTVEDMAQPLVLRLKGQVQGLHVTYSLSQNDSAAASPAPSPPELALDFGADVALQSTVQRTLILTNHTGITTDFSVQAAFFNGCSVPTIQENRNSTLIQRSARFAQQTSEKDQAEFRSSILSDGKGAAFIPQPASGTLGPFQQIHITVTAYNNLWGEYTDQLVCQVSDLLPKEIPLMMTVRGCPIYFQMTGPRPDRQTEGPVIRFGTHISGGDTISRCLRINNPSPCDIRIDWETYNREKDSSQLVDLVVLYGDPFPLKDIDGNEIVGSRSDFSESQGSLFDWDKIPNTSGTVSQSSSRNGNNGDVNEQTDIEDEDDRRDTRELTPADKLISVILRTHGGVGSDYPFCITPRQTIVPAGGSSTIHVSFTPLMLSGVVIKTECNGFALGFMSLDDKLARMVPGKVRRQHGYGIEPIKMKLQAFVKPALLTVELEDNDEDDLVFYSLASDLIPDLTTSRILTEFVTVRNLKLVNRTETPLYFCLLLSQPFAVSVIDVTKNMRTSQSDREEQGGQMVLNPQQNTLVKVSFCTTLELLTYQHLSADQLPPGVQILQSESGERKLHFTQQLVIEYSNKSSQHIRLSAFLCLPVLQLSCRELDFGTCFVGQTRTQEVYLLNKSRSKSYWTALLDKRERHDEQEVFSLSPTSGMLDAHSSHTSANKEVLLISFTARTNTEYATTVTIHGKLGELPLRLHIKGHGSHDEKYEASLSP